MTPADGRGDLEPECPSQRGASRASPAHPGASGFPAAHPWAVRCLSVALRPLQARRPRAADRGMGDSGPLEIPQEAPDPHQQCPRPRWSLWRERTVWAWPWGGHTAKRWQNYRWSTGLLDLNTTHPDQPCVMGGAAVVDMTPVRVCGGQGRGGGKE